MLFGTMSRVGPENDVSDGGAHWCHLANTIKPSVCGGDAALCQITLITRFDYLRVCASLWVQNNNNNNNKWHLHRFVDRFSRFCRTHDCDRQTDQQTNRNTTLLRIHVVLWWGLTIITCANVSKRHLHFKRRVTSDFVTNYIFSANGIHLIRSVTYRSISQYVSWHNR